MPGLNDVIPGLGDAEYRFRDKELQAFAGIEPHICGVVPVLPFTPRMFLELDSADNGFFRPKPLEAGDVLTFLWRVSPEFSRTDKEKRALFNATLGVTLEFDKAVEDIIAYVLRAWEGKPLYKKDDSGSMGSWPSRLVHVFASNYGWTEEYVLDMPYRRLWQYANRILEASDKEYIQRSPEAMKLRQDRLVKINERN